MARSISELEAEFAQTALRCAGALILTPSDAIAFIGNARAERFPVLGIDGFHIGGGAVTPDLGFSVDYSLNGYPARGSWGRAEAFVKLHSHDVDGFEIVIGEQRVARD